MLSYPNLSKLILLVLLKDVVYLWKKIQKLLGAVILSIYAVQDLRTIYTAYIQPF